MDTVNQIEFKVSDLNTRSVTLFPTRAQICREIKEVELLPGTNEITVTGLTPTLDEDSLKVEGSGSAVITDISVESLSNSDIFNVVYPSDTESDSDSDDEDLEKEDEALTEAKKKQDDVRERLDKAKEEEFNADERLKILGSHAKSVSKNKEKTIDIAEFLGQFKDAREAASRDLFAAKAKVLELQKQDDEVDREVRKLIKIAQRAEKKQKRASRQERAKKQAQKAKIRKQKAHLRSERIKFWPRTCYSVKITLEVNAMTPLSSRRNSVSSEAELIKVSEPGDGDVELAATKCDLLLTYITSSACWTPHYDMQLSTTNNTASLCFDAQLQNHTSETWKNCKVSLSTSEATFSGLNTNIPKLLPWHIRLAGSKDDGTDITRSSNEKRHRRDYAMEVNHQTVPQFGRDRLFGVENFSLEHDRSRRRFAGERRYVQQNPSHSYYSSDSDSDQGEEAMADGDNRRQRRSDFARPLMRMRGAPAVAAAAMAAPPQQWNATYAAEDERAFGGEKEETVDFEESLMEATGLTTTYDLPGTKTLAPRTTLSKQRVARINFSGVIFSHTVVAKYTPVAYLKAKLKNNSKLNLMPGATGLTLDGAFMGRTQIPRCSSGDVFSLSLGVDPAIKVSYPKPEVRRATTGLFTKESSSVYARAIILFNTRATASKAANMLVLDQVPVSEDDRLRVDVVTPAGLVVDSNLVATGAPLRENDRDRGWGKASAKLQNTGLINWDVQLNAGKAVKLWLEYSVSMPSGDGAVECHDSELR